MKLAIKSFGLLFVLFISILALNTKALTVTVQQTPVPVVAQWTILDKIKEQDDKLVKIPLRVSEGAVTFF